MSDSSGASASNSAGESGLDKVCSKVLRKLTAPATQPLPVSAHMSASTSMLLARDAVLRGEIASQEAKLSLLCAGISCMRRVTCESDKESQVAFLRTTQTLLFSLLVLMDSGEGSSIGTEEAADCMDVEQAPREGESNEEEGETPDNVDTSEEEAPRKKRKVRERDELQLVRMWSSSCLADKITEGSKIQASSWGALLKSDAAVSRAALTEGRFATGNDTMETLYSLSSIFFRTSASAMASSMLSAAAPSGSCDADFLSLSTMGILATANREKSLDNIADAAESEAGQTVSYFAQATQA